jgi:hypothetical protein
VPDAQNIFNFKIEHLGNQYFDFGVEEVAVRSQAGGKAFDQLTYWYFTSIDGT